jgi:hypothetical protein
LDRHRVPGPDGSTLVPRHRGYDRLAIARGELG